MRGSSIKIVRHIIKGELGAAGLSLWGLLGLTEPREYPQQLVPQMLRTESGRLLSTLLCRVTCRLSPFQPHT